MKGKSGGMDCGNHWYLDGLMILIGLGYFFGDDGLRVLGGFAVSEFLPAWGVLFIFLGLKMYMMKHGG